VGGVLITGGAGYIGSHTAKLLARNDCACVVLDDLSTGYPGAVPRDALVVGDIADAALLRRVLKSHKIEAVIHFAAHAYVAESMREPQKYFHNNVVKSLAMLETMMECGVRNIVFSSTCATYGHPLNGAIGEDHSQMPVNPYGESKLFLERALHWYGECKGLRWVTLRYFNAAGADPDGGIGEMHDPETHLVPVVIQAALGLRPHVDVFGTDYPTPDGTAVRDYVHVTDLAEAHVLALRYLRQGGSSRAFNLGAEQGHSVRDVIAAVERVSGRRLPVNELPRRPGDPASLVARARRARQILKWTPRNSALEVIVETAWKWHASFVNLARGTAACAISRG
jgi:UDP-glucose-4-epimerase GalE